jgi:hypothetical protein
LSHPFGWRGKVVTSDAAAEKCEDSGGTTNLDAETAKASHMDAAETGVFGTCGIVATGAFTSQWKG